MPNVHEVTLVTASFGALSLKKSCNTNTAPGGGKGGLVFNLVSVHKVGCNNQVNLQKFFSDWACFKTFYSLMEGLLKQRSPVE